MKLKVGLKLRKLGNIYMIVAADESSVNMTNVYNLNSVAADIWQHIGAGDFTIPQLVTYVCDEYDVDYNSAHSDVTALIENWKELGLVIGD